MECGALCRDLFSLHGGCVGALGKVEIAHGRLVVCHISYYHGIVSADPKKAGAALHGAGSIALPAWKFGSFIEPRAGIPWRPIMLMA